MLHSLHAIYKHIGLLMISFLAVFTTLECEGQTKSSSGVDTLGLKDRVALRFNLIDGLLTIPNVGVEFDVSSMNYNRWTVGLNLKWRPGMRQQVSPALVYNIFDIRLEARNYWRTRRIDNKYVARHTHIWDKAMSMRRPNPKHPKTTYYRGLYVGYSQYSLLFSANATGHQGSSVNIGGTYGVVRTLHQFRNGSSLDIDLGINVGISLVKSQEYKYYPDNCYKPITDLEGWKMQKFPLPHELRAALVYRIGSKPATEKYYFRYDVDDAFRDRCIAKMDSLEIVKTNEANADSLYNDGKQYYDKMLDSILRAYPELNVPTKTYIEKQQTEDEGRNVVVSVKKENKEKERKSKDAQTKTDIETVEQRDTSVTVPESDIDSPEKAEAPLEGLDASASAADTAPTTPGNIPSKEIPITIEEQNNPPQEENDNE